MTVRVNPKRSRRRRGLQRLGDTHPRAGLPMGRPGLKPHYRPGEPLGLVRFHENEIGPVIVLGWERVNPTDSFDPGVSAPELKWRGTNSDIQAV